MEKTCKECNKQFKTYNKQSKFCSRRCATIFRNKEKANGEVEIKCAFCENKFKVKYKYRNRKFCSKTCFSEWQKDIILSQQNRKNKSLGHLGKIPWNKNKTYENLYGDKAEEIKSKCASNTYSHPDVELTCKHCRKSFYVTYKNRNKRKYCSHKCSSSARRGVKRKPFSKKTRIKMSEASKGRVRKQSSEEIKNRRITAINKIQERLKSGDQLVPNWNPKTCDYFENFDKKNNTCGQHARRGGEYHIKELGYWLDYINHDLKLIMEYDEPYHERTKQKNKDIIRQEEIKNYFLGYKFIRIKDENIGN